MSTSKTPWEIVEQHLIRTGTISPEGVTRRAQPRRCRTCSAPTLVGFDDDLCALRADADPQPLSALAEALAQLEGRRTFSLVIDGNRLVLCHRNAGRITHRPATRTGQPAGRYDILAEHICHRPAYGPYADSFLTRTGLTLQPEGAPCPF